MMMPTLTLSRQQKLTKKVRAELRASHAGETGAVWIYRGILAANLVRRDPELRQFAKAHLATERQHLALFEERLNWFRGSYLLLLWIMAGFITGALPGLLGRDWVYYTIFQVESFVEAHYDDQIRQLDVHHHPEHRDIETLFRHCQAEEIHHKNEALSAMRTPPGNWLKGWGRLVKAGSTLAVYFAKRV